MSLFTNIVNILLTAAIAFAAIMQWLVSARLLQLQRLIEDQRTKAWLFLRLKPTARAGHQTALLQISNLSQAGVWIEEARLHLQLASCDKTESFPIEDVLPTSQVHSGFDIRPMA